jgi:hypothetical protein
MTTRKKRKARPQADVSEDARFGIMERFENLQVPARQRHRARFAVVEFDKLGPILRAGPFHHPEIARRRMRKLASEAKA